MIGRCTCKHDSRGNTAGVEYQESVYGKGFRLLVGPLGKLQKTNEYKCSICLDKKTIGAKSEDAKEDKKGNSKKGK